MHLSEYYGSCRQTKCRSGAARRDNVAVVIMCDYYVALKKNCNRNQTFDIEPDLERNRNPTRRLPVHWKGFGVIRCEPRLHTGGGAK